MNRVFRKIRLELMKKNKIGNYIKYAIGEIFLVVIGILIALQINNWNEDRKDEIYLDKIYAQVHQDLKRDTLHVNATIKFYKEKNERLEEIINREITKSYYDTINETNYMNCKKCVCDIATNRLFQYSDKGYQLLKTANKTQIPEKDSLSFLILDFYTFIIPALDDDGEILSDIMDEAVNEYQKYDWYVDWAFYQRYNKDYIEYIFESEEYRKKCVRYLIYSKYNYLRRLELFKKNATMLLDILDKELEEENEEK